MKTFATKVKRTTPTAYKSQPNTQQPMWPVHQAHQAEIRRIFFSTGAQAKLTIGQPNDKFEQQADRVADQVIAMPDPKLQHQPASDEEKTLQTKPLVERVEESAEDESIQAKSNPGETHAVSPSLETRINSLKGGGQPLDSSARSFFEPRFGYDFSHVRVHTDGNANQIARSVNARAFTLGENVVFGAGEYQPHSQEGKRFLGHELTHVMQQNGAQLRQGRHAKIQKQFFSASDKVIMRATEYDPGPGFNLHTAIPLVRNNIEASPGEEILFSIFFSDQDRQRTIGSAGSPWSSIQGQGPYEVSYQVSGDAEFMSRGSGNTQYSDNNLLTLPARPLPVIVSQNIKLFILNSWTGNGSITITATIRDRASAAVAPDQGSSRDSDLTITWTIVNRRNPCPTGLTKTSGPSASAWTNTGQQRYEYQAMPDIPPQGRPDYQNQTILERFGTVTASGFTMSDLTTSWKQANPQLNTPDLVANHIFGFAARGAGGTFVFDAQDKIADLHGFSINANQLSPFKQSAFADSDGVGFIIPQEYVCGGNVIGQANIYWRLRGTWPNISIEHRKSGP